MVWGVGIERADESGFKSCPFRHLARSSKSMTTFRCADDTGKALAIQNINAIHMTTKAVQRLMAVP